ncbi:hypothetical protein CPLU01_12872 [Colletotrichum plurivorum]|uniref:Uncharacterized protein n=1 Tax=Colletotrichum plurivorum TaxID=2175906 RepID=A0A8H6JVB4_9PEZI|nr:hypothetical protein CPLU01_12872 [Colletotrichum plurivorum]
MLPSIIVSTLAAAAVMVRAAPVPDDTDAAHSKQGQAGPGLNPDYAYVVFKRDEAETGKLAARAEGGEARPKQGQAGPGLNSDYSYVVFKREAEAPAAHDHKHVEVQY